jgi:hypothetical protein
MPYKRAEESSTPDSMAIRGNTQFADCVHAIIAERRPTRIIETGTFEGTGTTAIIGSGLKNAGITQAEFFSIEVNPKRFDKATENVKKSGINVQLKLGLSIPRQLLLSPVQIHQQYVQRVVDGIYVEWSEKDRPLAYHHETNFPDLPDDLLGSLLTHFQNRPDFLLLDSAGHLGYIEFQYVKNRMNGPCVLVLDDTRHVKHFQSVADMKSDRRFRILTESEEKFGFCIAEFNP